MQVNYPRLSEKGEKKTFPLMRNANGLGFFFPPPEKLEVATAAFCCSCGLLMFLVGPVE